VYAALFLSNFSWASGGQETMEEVGDKLKNLRKLKGWSQEQLARELGVSLNTVQRWETGRNKPSALAREKLQRLFDQVEKGDQLKLFQKESGQ
jgi:putative transcriptional regulator